MAEWFVIVRQERVIDRVEAKGKDHAERLAELRHPGKAIRVQSRASVEAEQDDLQRRARARRPSRHDVDDD